MVMKSSEDGTTSFDLKGIVLGIVDEHLERNEGACLLSVKTVMKTMRRRLGIKESRTLTVEIDEILDGLPRSRFWGHTSSRTWKYENGKQIKIPGIKSRLYSLRRAS